MGRIAYVNGRFVRHADAAVHIEDRGFQLGDGVYEVWAVFQGRLADAAGHFTRLKRSLGELKIAMPMDERALKIVLRETLRRNRLSDGVLYLQVNRGVARRDHAFPDPPVAPSIVITARAVDLAAGEARAAKGVGVIAVDENRWGRCDIKTIGLLPNVLAKQAAREAGATEAWFVDANGVLRTRDVQANILRGVTRNSVIRLIGELGLSLDERAFTLEEAKSAREAFITGAGSLVLPVVRIDGTIVGDGAPGPVAKRLRELYMTEARRKAA